MNTKLIENDIQLRKADPDDVKKVYDLAMDKLVRESSFSTEEITYENHVAWYKNKLSDDNFFLFIAEDQNNFAGQVKFDIENNESVIGISIAPNYRGRGLGHILIKKGIDKLTELRPQIKISNAYIKKDNIPSIKIFAKAGFIFREEAVVKGCPANKYIFNIK